MAFYVIPYLFVFSFSLLLESFKTKKVSIGLIFVVLFPALLVELLRGEVGTDTANYLEYFRLQAVGSDHATEFEYFFELFTLALVKLGASEKTFVNSIAIISTLLLSLSFKGAKEKAVLLFLTVFPLFYYDFTMNGLRYGLSFSIAAVAIDAYFRNKTILFIILSIVAVLTQYSALLLVLVFPFYTLKTKYLIGSIALISLLVAGTWGFLQNVILYLTLKQEAYQDLVAPSLSSGAVPLFIVLVLSIGFISCAKKTKDLKGIYLIIFFELVSFVIAKFTYAGLRLQMLFLFALLLFVKHHLFLIEKRNAFFKLLMFLSLLSFLVFLKNITAVIEGDISPFLPYKFFWE